MWCLQTIVKKNDLLAEGLSKDEATRECGIYLPPPKFQTEEINKSWQKQENLMTKE